MMLDDIIKEIEDEAEVSGSHSDIGASKANEWFNCPGSVKLSAGQPDYKRPSAIEGSFLHKLGEKLLRKQIDIFTVNSFAGEEVTVNGHYFKITETMTDGIVLYFDTIAQRLCDKPTAALMVEQKFCIESVDSQAFGTADAVIVEPFKSLEIIDLKTGFRKIDPNSKQNKYYCLGVFEKFDFGYDTIDLTIVQPSEPLDENKVKTHRITRAELMEFKEELKAAVAKVRVAGANATANVKAGDWCLFCKGKAICPEQQKTALAIVENGFDDLSTVETPTTLSEDKMVWLLKNEEKIVDFLACLRTHATEQAKKGQMLPGFKLVKPLSNRAWLPEAENFLIRALGDEAYKVTRKLQTPKQTEDLLKAKSGRKKSEIEDILSPFYFNPDRGVVLAEDSDKRPAVNYFDDVVDMSLL